MEVKDSVTTSVIKTVRNSLEVFAIIFVIVLPLAVIAFATMNTDISAWKIVTCGIAGTLIWWSFCWVTFWLVVE